MTNLLWALWIMSGGQVNSGYLVQPQIVAYFQTVEGCEKAKMEVQRLMTTTQRAMQCIQSDYRSPK